MHRRWVTAGIGLVALSLMAPATSTAGGSKVMAHGDPLDPAVGGQFGDPFEEGGAAQPRCVEDAGGRVACKPTAVSISVLPDGRLLYWNGLEGTENVDYAVIPELGEASRNSQARILDLRSGTPVWEAVPTGEQTNPNIVPGRDEPSEADPFGALGAPGRPGDGLTGSTVGSIVSANPTSPPDDPEDNDDDLFCSYQVRLADGRLAVFGGSDWYAEPDAPGQFGVVEVEGLRTARTYDAGDGWRALAPMKYGRWYPSGVTLGDGRVLAVSGVTKLVKNAQLSNVRRPEVLDPATGTWTEQYTGPASENSLPLYPRLHLLPDGRVFYDGNGQAYTPMGQAADEATWAFQQTWDPATQQWSRVGTGRFGNRSGALDVLLPLRPPYDHASVLMAGGVVGPTPGSYVAMPFSEEVTVTGGTAESVRTGDLVNRRWFSQGTVLPDGTVLATSGGDVDEVIFPGSEAPVAQAEIYDPTTKTWRAAATAHRGRTYHNSAVLLGDGRVLVGGHSPLPGGYGHHRDIRPGGNNDKDPSFEVYSPPYLFRGPRPRIDYAPAGVAWGSDFTLTVPAAGDIESVTLVRLAATTHVLDNDQRTIFLDFERTSAATLAVTAPPSGAVAPGGDYYLFVNRRTDNGPVPSVARIVRVGAVTDTAEATQPYPDDAPAPSGGSATPVEDTTFRMPGPACPGCASAPTGLPVRSRVPLHSH